MGSFADQFAGGQVTFHPSYHCPPRSTSSSLLLGRFSFDSPQLDARLLDSKIYMRLILQILFL